MPFREFVKNYSADLLLLLRRYPPPTSCPLAENHFAKKTLAAMGGTYTDFTTYAASEKKGYHAWNGVDWRLSLLLRSAKA